MGFPKFQTSAFQAQGGKKKRIHTRKGGKKSRSTNQPDALIKLHLSGGKHNLHVLSFYGCEELSSLSFYELIVEGDDKAFDFKKLLGTDIIIEMLAGEKGFFHGVLFEVSRCPQSPGTKQETNTYRLAIYSKLALLKRSQRCRIFQKKSPKEIITDILKAEGITVDDRASRSGKEKREYCVQYNESDFDFVSRLMEEEGIFYFFEAAEKEHKMILGDNTASHKDIAAPSTIPYMRTQAHIPFSGQVLSYEKSEEMPPQKYTLADYDFMSPQVKLKGDAQGSGKTGDYFVYPGRFKEKNEGEALAKRHIEALEVSEVLLSGTSTVARFSPGSTFNLEGHKDKSIKGQQVLHKVEHHFKDPKSLTQEEAANAADAHTPFYYNHFTAFPGKTPFRPLNRTPKPMINGLQTGFVTGPSGEEIATEEGCIKVKFHWDIEGEDDENSSCWVRVAQVWAGNGWGANFIPRVGQEVIISFLDGNPDRPLVVGCVHNADNLPVFETQTQSGIKTQTTPDGEGSNEIRFDDKKEEEEFYMHAQGDMNVEIEKNLTTKLTEGDRQTTLEKGSDILELTEGDQTITITGNQKTTITEEQEITIEKGVKQTIGEGFTLEIGGDASEKIEGAYTGEVGGDFTLEVKGGLTIKATGDITIDAGGALDLKSTGAMTFSATGAQTLETKGAFKIDAAAGDAEISCINFAATATAEAGISANAGLKLETSAGDASLATSAGSAKLSGISAELEGTASAKVSGPMATLEGSAMAEISGGLVKIN